MLKLIAPGDLAMAREFVERLTCRYYPDVSFEIKLFGSRARGDADAESDLDLFVVIKGAVDLEDVKAAALDIACELTVEHGILVTPFVADQDFLNRHRGFSFLEAVQAEGIVL